MNDRPRQGQRVHLIDRCLLNTFAEIGIPYNDDDDGLGLGESLFWEDIKQWVEAMQLVNEAAVSLRTAQPDAEIAAATQRLYFEASRARDCKSCPPARGVGVWCGRRRRAWRSLQPWRAGGSRSLSRGLPTCSPYIRTSQRKVRSTVHSGPPAQHHQHSKWAPGVASPEALRRSQCCANLVRREKGRYRRCTDGGDDTILCAVWQPHHKMLVKICCEAVHKHPTRMPWTHASVRPLTASRSVATTMELEL